MPLRTDLLDPIPGENPAGSSIRYDPVYDQIRIARTEEDELPQGEWQRERKVADFSKVVRLSGEVLAGKSKDLQVAAWLAEGLLRTEGYGSFREALVLIRELMERYWDHLYPEIDEDGDLEFRAAPLEWLGSYLDGSVRSVPLTRSGLTFIQAQQARSVPGENETDSNRVAARQTAIAEGKTTPEEWEEAVAGTPKAFYRELHGELGGALEALHALEAFTDEHFVGAQPGYKKLRTALEEVHHAVGLILKRKLELEPDPPEMEQTVLEAAGAGHEGGGDAREGSPEGGAAPTAPPTAEPASRQDAAARVAAAVRWLRRENPTDPTPYLVIRALRWGELRAGGSPPDPKLLEAPPTPVRTRLRSLILDGRWAEVLEHAEEAVAQPFGRGWLDLQRYTLEACRSLGSDYDGVAAVVRSSLASLLADMPELLQATLMDDSPTVNAETRTWLQEEGLVGSSPGGAAAEPLRTPRRERDAFDLAMDRVRSGQVQQGIQLLMREAAQEQSARARFLRRSQAAGIMVDHGMGPVAQPILREMLQQIESHRLEEWEEGETVARPLGLLYRCLAQHGDPEGLMNDLYLRVCRLDPLQAMTFQRASDGGTQGGDGGW